MAIYGSVAPGLLVEVGHTYHPVGPSRGSHRQPRVVFKYWARMSGAPLDAGIDVLVIMQLEFQQSETVEMPQIQFLDRLLDIPVVTQRWVLTVQIVQNTSKIPQVQCVVADVPVIVATSSSSSPWQTAQKTFRLVVDVRALMQEALRFVHRQGHDGLRRRFSRIFTAFLALRPLGRRVPTFGSPRWPTVVGGRGLTKWRGRREFYSQVIWHM